MTKPAPFVYNATLVRVIDGDTIECDLDLGMNLTARFPVRILGINTPELATMAGRKVREALAFSLAIGAKAIVVRSVKWDKYGGRLLGDVTVIPAHGEPLNLAQWMVAEGLALPWNGKGKKPVFPAAWPAQL